MKRFAFMLAIVAGMFVCIPTTHAKTVQFEANTELAMAKLINPNIPRRVALRVLWKARPALIADTGIQFTMWQMVWLYRQDEITITHLQGRTFRVAYQDCITIVTLGDAG